MTCNVSILAMREICGSIVWGGGGRRGRKDDADLVRSVSTLFLLFNPSLLITCPVSVNTTTGTCMRR